MGGCTSLKKRKLTKRKFTVRSKNKNLRLCILENSIYIEELISMTIGNLLGIDWENSKSFGFSSSSMSFNHKIQIIKDIKGIEKDMIKKFTCLLNIRNKFAHVYSITCFMSLYSLSKNGKEIENLLKKSYPNEHPDDSEKENRYYFYFLVDEIIEFLHELSQQHSYEIGFKRGRNRAQEAFLFALIDEVRLLEHGDDIIKRAEQSI